MCISLHLTEKELSLAASSFSVNVNLESFPRSQWAGANRELDPVCSVPMPLRWSAGLQLDCVLQFGTSAGAGGETTSQPVQWWGQTVQLYHLAEGKVAVSGGTGWAVGCVRREAAWICSFLCPSRAWAPGVSLLVNTPREEVKLTRIFQRFRSLWHVTALGWAVTQGESWEGSSK